MPKTKETSNHPCHFLSLPSARRFWCRHCMSVFEDAITRWRHSRSCRYGVVNNFMRRRQLEAKALQNTNKPNPIEARLEKSVSPSEEPIAADEAQDQGGESSGVEKTNQANQATADDLYRCFICQSKFSTLEEMRYHVKYPCNNKKIVTDVPNPAMTVYIDELTDRSRPWDPQPHQEEVVSSEFVPNIVSQETVQSTVESKHGLLDASLPSSESQENKITPTNIYVNEQGETVIEVENLDLNAEGGELSLAHLLTQLSQQGIVFDKNKASQMQAHQETTLADPTSGEIYTTGTSYDPQSHTSSSALIKEEDEGQPTAEDAANTLAQLSVFRSYRTNPGSQVVQTASSSDMQKEYVVEGANVGYTYVEDYTAGDVVEAPENHQNIKVEYDYSYLPTQQANSEGSAPHISASLASSILGVANAQTGTLETGRDHSNVHSLPTVHFHQDLQPQMVTYISSSPGADAQETQTAGVEGDTVLIENVVMEDQSIANPSQQYHMNLTTSDTRLEDTHKVSIEGEMEGNQNSYIVLNTEDNTTQIVCSPHSAQQLTVGLNSMAGSILSSEGLSNNHNSLPQHYNIPISSHEETEREGELKDGEEYEVQTVTLQEIAENESSGTVSFVQNHSSLTADSTAHQQQHVFTSTSVNAQQNNLPDNQLVSSDSNQCVQLDILQPTANDMLTSDRGYNAGESVSHQQHQPQEENVSSVNETSSLPVYVVSSDGGLQLLTPAQHVRQSVAQQDHHVMPSRDGETQSSSSENATV